MKHKSTVGLRQPSIAAGLQLSDIFGGDASDGNGSDSDDALTAPDDGYRADVAGRELGIQPVPRFVLSELRAFEAMFVDDKEYVRDVRGGVKQTLVSVDYKTRAKTKLDVGSKKHSINGQAFRKMLIRFGVHKLPY